MTDDGVAVSLHGVTKRFGEDVVAVDDVHHPSQRLDRDLPGLLWVGFTRQTEKTGDKHKSCEAHLTHESGHPIG